MPHDVAYFLSQSVADFARFAATLNVQLETLTDQLAAVTAERDALKADVATTRAEQPT